jgi:hypothetical protein
LAAQPVEVLSVSHYFKLTNESVTETLQPEVTPGFRNVSSSCGKGAESDQEAEAYGVGAAALLPWHLFFLAVNAGRTVEELAEENGVTPSPIDYRIKITGAYRVYKARQRKKA